MRAQEFITESELVTFNGIQLEVLVDDDTVDLRALRDGHRLGYAVFSRDGNILTPTELTVFPQYRKQGVARTMYDYAQSLGFKIHASQDQTAAGRSFWKKHRGQERVWESPNSSINS
jgi:GNAT superfamily N-acetyltransferase